MSGTCFVDTNLLVYARDTSEPAKQIVAVDWLAMLWATKRGRLSFQVLQEFYVTVTRKLKPGMDPLLARSDVRDLTAWRPVPPDAALLERAFAAQDRFGFSFWDALILASAQSGGCRYLLSEDLQDHQDLDGVIVVNPFVHGLESVG